MKSRLFTTHCISVFLILQTMSFTAFAVIWSEANLEGELFTPSSERDGGLGFPTAELSNSGSDELAGSWTRSSSGWSYASAENGRIALDLSSTTSVTSGSPPKSGAFVSVIDNRVKDSFMIGAGTGPSGEELTFGDAAQVLLQIQLDGSIQVEGQPFGSNLIEFRLLAGDQFSMPEVALYQTGIITPPQSFEVHEFWSVNVPVTVGFEMRIDSLMNAWLGSTSYFAGESGTSFMNINHIFRVSNASGYDLTITSEAGAPISPSLFRLPSGCSVQV